ncbi:MAG: CarD family transcriptional regulator, partial [Planctomycetota bacterium]
MDSPVLDRLTRDPATRRLARALTSGVRAVGTGASGSSPSFTAAAIAGVAKAPVVLVCAHLDETEEAADELASAGVPVLKLPALEALPGESRVAADLLGERLAAVRAAVELTLAPGVVVASIHALMQRVPKPGTLDRYMRTVGKGDRLDPADLIEWLAASGYQRVDAIEEPGDFAVRGGILDVFSPGGGDGPGGRAVRLDFFGDELDAIAEIDLDTMGSDRRLDEADIVAATLDEPTDRKAKDRDTLNFLELLPSESLAVLVETMEVVEQGRGYYERVTDPAGIDGPPAVLKLLQERFDGFCELNQYSAGATGSDERVELPVAPLPAFDQDAAKGVVELADLTRLHGRVLVVCQKPAELARLRELLTEFAPERAPDVEGVVAYIHRGFVWESSDEGSDALASLCVVPYHELLHRFGVRRRTRRLRSGRAMDTFLEFETGDYVVHAEHGIARFAGLTQMTPKALPGRVASGEPEEFLTLEFAGRSRLHVPATQIDQVQRYVGGFAGKPPLSTIGGKKWKNQKQAVADSVHDLAGEMLRVRAARDALPGVRYPADTRWQTEFEAEFPYDETEDQLAGLSEIKKDMQGERPMDRLLCGDVGFGLVVGKLGL